MSNYTMEQLIPVVADLTDRYTSRDSTSVSYNTARQLMDAVIYCIDEYERGASDGNAIATTNMIEPMEAYRIGRDSIVKKVKKLQLSYSMLVPEFKDYGNKNYRDTFFGGISGFLKYYDYRYNPQNSVITMDYPVLNKLSELGGIITVEQYFRAIYIEQQFLKKFPEDYVIAILTAYDTGYSRQFYNISRILLRNMIGCMIAEKNPQDEPVEEDYERIDDFLNSNNKDELCAKLSQILQMIVDRQYEGNKEILEYFSYDMKDLAVELLNGSRYHTLAKVITL